MNNLNQKLLGLLVFSTAVLVFYPKPAPIVKGAGPLTLPLASQAKVAILPPSAQPARPAAPAPVTVLPPKLTGNAALASSHRQVPTSRHQLARRPTQKRYTLAKHRPLVVKAGTRIPASLRGKVAHTRRSRTTAAMNISRR